MLLHSLQLATRSGHFFHGSVSTCSQLWVRELRPPTCRTAVRALVSKKQAPLPRSPEMVWVKWALKFLLVRGDFLTSAFNTSCEEEQGRAPIGSWVGAVDTDMWADVPCGGSRGGSCHRESPCGSAPSHASSLLFPLDFQGTWAPHPPECLRLSACLASWPWPRLGVTDRMFVSSPNSYAEILTPVWWY